MKLYKCIIAENVGLLLSQYNKVLLIRRKVFKLKYLELFFNLQFYFNDTKLLSGFIQNFTDFTFN